jgi:LysR family glycine cleavage system transcriptional activator
MDANIPTLRLPPLNALRAFEATARHLSFRRAAEELFVTQGAVSRHILKLEGFLGIRLFVRLHKRVELTREGNSYLHEVRDAFLRISHATRNLTAGTDAKLLRIKLPPTCAIRWLVPRLGRFHAHHPDFAVQVTTSHDPVSFDRDEVDAAIQYGEAFGPQLVSERLFREVLIPVCSKTLIRRPHRLARASDVARHVLLHSIRRPSDWQQWFKAAGVPDYSTEQGMSFENSTLTYQGAVDGLGIAIAQYAFVADDLASGRLVAPLDIRVHNTVGYHLVIPADRERLAKIRAFKVWIAAEAALTRRSDAWL